MTSKEKKQENKPDNTKNENGLEKFENKEQQVEGSFSELMEDAPPEVREKIVQMLALSSHTSRGVSSHHPLFDKFTEEHVDKFLDYSHDDDVRSHDIQKSNRVFNLIYFLVFLSFIVFLIVYLLPIDKNLLLDLIKIIVAFAGGFGTGYGVKGHFDKKEK